MSTPERYSLSELERIPTISQGWDADLKVDNGKIRVWLQRELFERYDADDNSRVIKADA